VIRWFHQQSVADAHTKLLQANATLPRKVDNVVDEIVQLLEFSPAVPCHPDGLDNYPTTTPGRQPSPPLQVLIGMTYRIEVHVQQPPKSAHTGQLVACDQLPPANQKDDLFAQLLGDWHFTACIDTDVHN